MSVPRLATILVSAGLFGLVPAADALAQVCIGLPIRDGQMSLEGQVIGRAQNGGEVGYGGRLGIDFNTPLTLDFGVERSPVEADLGTTVSGAFAFEIFELEPSVCPLAGIRYERRPAAGGHETTTTLPIGIGFGKRLGSAKLLSLALFAVPEYVFVLEPDDTAADDSFLDQVGDRSQGRGVLGLIVATPFLYATGSVRVTTVDGDEPILSLGIGMIF